MKLYEEMIKNIKEKKIADLSSAELTKILENKCYMALSKIRDIIREKRYDDDECFDKIEEIVCLFEAMGIGVNGRHDFG